MQKSLFYKTPSKTTFVKITDDVNLIVKESGVKNGICYVFVKSTTSALLILEDEEGVKKDLLSAFEKIASKNQNYAHNQSAGDVNAFAHLRAEILGCDLGIPIKDGALDLGTWQNIFLIDFDNKPREREVVVTIINAE